MTMENLAKTARLLVADGRGLLAMDESDGTCDKRFIAAGIPVSAEGRRRYRELLITAPASIPASVVQFSTMRRSGKPARPACHS